MTQSVEKLPPVTCKAGQMYQYVVLGDGTAAIRDRSGDCIGYVESHTGSPKGRSGWCGPLSRDCEFPLMSFRRPTTDGLSLITWRTDEKRLEGIALAELEIARKANHAQT